MNMRLSRGVQWSGDKCRCMRHSRYKYNWHGGTMNMRLSRGVQWSADKRRCMRHSRYKYNGQGLHVGV